MTKNSKKYLRMAESRLAPAEKLASNMNRRGEGVCGWGVTLHLIDIDNLLGDPRTVDRAFIGRVLEHYREVSGYRSGDHVVIATGCNGLHVLEVELAWPGVRHRRMRGADGADQVLHDEAEWAAEHGAYSRVVIASGDRFFILSFQALLAAGFDVEVVANHRRLASGLAAVAHGRIRYFSDPDSFRLHVPHAA